MARPQKFDYAEVVDRAKALFWLKGYANTSVKDLTEVTSLLPGSLYAAFSSKRGLFIEVLDSYFENTYTNAESILLSEEQPLKRIRQFFEHVIKQMEKDQQTRSCLMVNTLLEIPPNDREINQRVSAMFGKVETLFCQVLIEAQIEGSLAAGSKPDSLAKMLLSGLMGLQAYNKMQPGQTALKQIVNNLLSTLEKVG